MKLLCAVPEWVIPETERKIAKIIVWRTRTRRYLDGYLRNCSSHELTIGTLDRAFAEPLFLFFSFFFVPSARNQRFQPLWPEKTNQSGRWKLVLTAFPIAERASVQAAFANMQASFYHVTTMLIKKNYGYQRARLIDNRGTYNTTK